MRKKICEIMQSSSIHANVICTDWLANYTLINYKTWIYHDKMLTQRQNKCLNVVFLIYSFKGNIVCKE